MSAADSWDSGGQQTNHTKVWGSWISSEELGVISGQDNLFARIFAAARVTHTVTEPEGESRNAETLESTRPFAGDHNMCIL